MSASITGPRTPEPEEVPARYGDRFVCVRKLKAGQGVDTWLARDTSDGAEVVLKLAPAAHVGALLESALVDEAHRLAETKSVALVPILALARQGGDLFSTRPFVQGSTLRHCLKAGPLSVADVLTVSLSLLEALAEAHQKLVLHQGLRPSNVIVQRDGPVLRSYLIDFGLARTVRLDPCVANQPASSIRYLAPEQAGLLRLDASERSDLYALGVLLYEALSGEALFRGRTVGELFRQQLTLVPPPLRELGLAVPSGFDDVLKRLLSKDPRDRFPSAPAVASELREVHAQLERATPQTALSLTTREQSQTLREPVFVGRSQELVNLDERLDRARRGAGGLVFLEAASGSGKTRLLEEFARRAASRGASVFRGQGVDQAAQHPFRVLDGVVSELIWLTRADRELAAKVQVALGVEAEVVCAALPELTEILGPLSGESLGPEEYGEARTIPTLAALLSSLGSSSRPAIVLLDDCQWADELSTKLLAAWHRAASGDRRTDRYVLVVAAFRPEDVHASHLLKTLAAPRLKLPLLRAEELHELAESMAGTLPDEALSLVDQLSDGSPFMAAEVLLGLVETGMLVRGHEGWQVRHERVAEVQASRRAATLLMRRLELLPEQTLHLLSVGAVLGKEFPLRLVAKLASQSLAEAWASAEEARRRQILWSDAERSGWRFVHDKLREALLGRLAVEERRELHRLAALQIQAEDPRRVFELAYHFDAAGLPERAVPYALKAAEQARARYAPAIAETQYRIAERGASSAGPALRQQVAERLGEVLMVDGQYDAAAEQLMRAASLAEDNVTRARLQGKLGELEFKRGDMDSAAAALESALRLLGRLVPKRWLTFFVLLLWELAVQVLHTLFPRSFLARREPTAHEEDQLAIYVYDRLGFPWYFRRGAIPTAWAHLRHLNLAERYPPSAELAKAYSNHGPVCSFIPLFGRATLYCERALVIQRELGDLWGIGNALLFKGGVLYFASRYAQALSTLREAIELLERAGDRWDLNTARYHTAFCHYRLGDLERALEVSRDAYSAGLEIGDAQGSSISLEIWAKSDGGRVPIEVIEAEMVRPRDDVQATSQLLQAEAVRRLASGALSESVQVFERAHQLVRHAGIRNEMVASIFPWLVTARRRWAEVASPHAPGSRIERLRLARRDARRAVRQARYFRNNLPHALREAALVEAMRGRSGRARHLLGESLDVAREQGARYEQAQSVLARGRVGLVVGWPEAARDLAAARSELDALGADFALGAPLDDEAVTPSDRALDVVRDPTLETEALSVVELERARLRMAVEPRRNDNARPPLVPTLALFEGSSVGEGPSDDVLCRELRRALERDELDVHYQPIVTLEEGTIRGFEALFRWNHSELGALSPSVVIPAAEAGGLIIPVTWWLLRRACGQLMEWIRRFELPPDFTMSVNFSPALFEDEAVVEHVAEVLDEVGLDGHRLRLEITESVVTERPAEARALLLGLRARGTCLALDDFGTGYSSLSYLHRLPLDAVKIDRSFVSRMDVDLESTEIVRMIVSLGQTLRMDVIAEGIETAHQLAQLRALGCDYGQGFLFSRAVDAPAATELLERWPRW